MKAKIALAILFILVIFLVDDSLFVSAKQPLVIQETFSSPEVTDYPASTNSPSSPPTNDTSIAAKTVLGFGGSFKANYTFSSRNLTINGDVFWAGNIEILLNYSIDGLENHTLPIKLTCPYPDHILPLAYINGSAILPLFPVGNHNITVYGKWTATFDDHDEVELAQATLNFTIRAPVIKVFSPQNTGYPSKDLPVNFTANQLVSWAGYCLDNQNNVTLTENYTLTSLTYGNHTLTVYANDTAGIMGASQTINFNIEAPSQPFSLLIFVAVTTVLAAMMIIGIVVYRRHRRTSKQSVV